MMNKNEFDLNDRRYFSFIIVPPSGKEALRLRVSKNVVFGTLLGIFALILVVTGGIYYTTQVSVGLQQYKASKHSGGDSELNSMSVQQEIQALRSAMRDLKEREEDMRRILGSRKKSSFSPLEGTPEAKRFDQDFDSLTTAGLSQAEQLSVYVEFLKSETVDMGSKFRRLSHRVERYQTRFASTPSVWPIYGSIRSDYGWRIHPRTGVLQFHKGVDIPSWTGAPVKATANGTVQFAGWESGYGWVVIVSHEYGFSTVYAHLSEILVSERRPIRKGQVIGKIGETGVATGPHVHYEVRRWRRSIDPRPYLDLDMFTASTKLW